MAALHPSVADKVANLPESPGVYLWRDQAGTVLYVGKAKRLRSRVRNYLSGDHPESVKAQALMHQAADVETIVVPTEAHALILEANLIKEYHPKYNIALRDDKSYSVHQVTIQEPFPRVYVTRHVVDDGGRYFGPYTDVAAMRRALNVVKRIFTVRSCTYDLPKQVPERPCLDYYIKRCKAPCILAQTQAEYGTMIDEVLLFLEGKTREVIRRVRERLELASESLDFDNAAELRDALRHLEKMEEPTVVLSVEGGDRDVIGYARDGDDACVALLRIRGGRLLAREHQFLENIEEESDADALEAYLAGVVSDARRPCGGGLCPVRAVGSHELLESSLERTAIRVPQRGPKRELVDLATQNARHLLEEMRLAGDEADERAGQPIYELQRQLGLQKLPRALVCFDISHAQGTDTVASCVWFQNGRPYRAEYRKFKVKTVEGVDDFASMREVVSRYFTRRRDEEKPLPDLVLIDGGKGQLEGVATARSTGRIGPGGRCPWRVLPNARKKCSCSGRQESLRLPRRSPALRLLQQARDEAHRFAITFQRKRRTMRTITSELLRIPGIGEAKRRQLLQAFGSLEGVRAATRETDRGAAGVQERDGGSRHHRATSRDVFSDFPSQVSSST